MLAVAVALPLLALIHMLVTAQMDVLKSGLSGYGGVAAISVLVASGLFLSLRRLSISIDGDSLVVRAALFTRRVRIAELDLAAARVADLDNDREWRPVLRTNGIGLPGACMGHHRGKPWERRIFCALTSHERVLVLPERNGVRCLLLSAEKPKALLGALAALH
ncbi:hypothetical protein OS187_07445 [Xanthomonadaceae bacterium JHOS43]|nr:hypothetical protein [Xanthomonadaceae bacterium JHOS43]MCX7562859.1 hypothetical protein [Xanthomonadaceae bacterium XH05]